MGAATVRSARDRKRKRVIYAKSKFAPASLRATDRGSQTAVQITKEVFQGTHPLAPGWAAPGVGVG